MAGLTKGTLDDLITSFNTNVDGGDYTAAKKDLTKAEAVLASLPNTDKLSWRGALDRCWKMVEDLQASEDSTRRPKRLLIRRGRF